MIHRLEQRRGSDVSDAGFTLIEVIASLMVFAISSLAVVALLTSALNVSRKNSQRVQAAQVAMQAIQTARDRVKNSLAIPDSATSNVTVGPTTYTVTTTASWTNVGAADSLCTGAVPGEVAYRRIAASVTWDRMSGTPAVTSTTIATPLDPNSITIPIQVLSGTKAPDAGLPITLMPPSGAPISATTDANGCAIFAQLTPQTYTAEINVTGYVDSTSAAVTDHKQVVGQPVPGVVPIVTIFYDHPATLSVAPAFDTGFTSTSYPLPSSGMADTLQQTGWSDGSTQVYSAIGGALSRTVFPFAAAPGSGYSAYAGGCAAQANGHTVSTPLGTPASGNTGSLAVPVVSKIITVSVSGSTQGGVTVKASDSPDGCGDTYTLTGTTVSSGSTKGQIKFSLPAGNYVFSATISGRSRKSGTISIQSPSNGSSPISVSMS